MSRTDTLAIHIIKLILTVAVINLNPRLYLASSPLSPALLLPLVHLNPLLIPQSLPLCFGSTLNLKSPGNLFGPAPFLQPSASHHFLFQ